MLVYTDFPDTEPVCENLRMSGPADAGTNNEVAVDTKTEPSRRSLTLCSEGTRIAADIFLPGGEEPAAGFPAILMCHGWGGVKAQLLPFAEAIAREGFAALVFDYRGWGESDGRIIATPTVPPLLEAGERTLTVRVLREIVDPIDQVADANNCLHVLRSEPGIDPERIGVWGTSYGAGHAVFLGGTNPFLRAVVAQVGGYGLGPQYHAHARARAVEKARGQLDPVVPQGGLDGMPRLAGSADVARMLLHAPLTAAEKIRVPTLIIDVDNEELVDRMEHGHAAYEIIRQNAVSEYVLLPGAHYDIYDKLVHQAMGLALGWFKKYL